MNLSSKIPSGYLTVCHGIDGPFIDGLPIENVFFHGYVKYPDGICISFRVNSMIDWPNRKKQHMLYPLIS